MFIQNGRGNGDFRAGVDVDGRVFTKSIVVHDDNNANEFGLSWTFTFSVTTTGTDNVIFYVKNTGNDELELTDIRIFSDQANDYDFAEVTGTPSGGTAITPANKNLGSAKTPEVTVEDGIITGLTYGTQLYNIYVKANDLSSFKTSSHIKIPNNKAMAIRWRGTTGAVLKGTVSIHKDVFNHPELI